MAGTSGSNSSASVSSSSRFSSAISSGPRPTFSSTSSSSSSSSAAAAALLSKSWTSWKIFLGICLFRQYNALFVSTTFSPDEYWQSLEVAHYLVYGYGYLTWEWLSAIRGIVHPLFFVVVYEIMNKVCGDECYGSGTSAAALIVVPKMVQGLISALTDWYTFKLTEKWFGRGAAKWGLFCSLISWFNFYCGVRTLANSMETCLVVIALYWWPFHINSSLEMRKGGIRRSFFFVSLCCLVRPTSAILWAYFGLVYIVSTRRKMYFLFRVVLPFLVGSLLLSMAVDRLFYGKWTLVQLNFLNFNVFQNKGTFYGSHPFFWYFYNGFPTMLSTLLPLFIGGMIICSSDQRVLGFSVLWYMLCFSFLGHKEFRFLYPLMPVCLAFCGTFLNELRVFERGKDLKRSLKTLKSKTLSLFSFRLVLVLGLLGNIPLAFYFSAVHQRGTLDAISFIRQEVYNTPDLNSDLPVLILMPCHSTPLYSHIHRNITVNFLTCSPIYMHDTISFEQDTFYANPQSWMERYFEKSARNEYIEYSSKHNPKCNCNVRWVKPRFIVFFDRLLPMISAVLQANGYRERQSFFHTQAPEGRVGKDVLVYEEV
eukprot:Nk52_evm60s2118 gene=Nk52_evmTU60s2118